MFGSLKTGWYGVLLAGMLLTRPAMAFSVSEVGDYVRGVEFRTFMGEIFIQIFSGFANAFFTTLAAMFFGLLDGV